MSKMSQLYANTQQENATMQRLCERIARLEADLLECREYLEQSSDVVDGDYGEPRPNKAMRLCSMIDETLNDDRAR